MSNSLSLLSKYRTQLMGVAMLAVMFFHGMDFKIYFIEWIRWAGTSGVDMFFFLSGIGIYYSVSNNTLKEYYLKRVMRIIPVFIPLAVILAALKVLLYDIDPSAILYNLFIFFTIWPDIPCVFWYIPCAMLLYILSPAFYRFFKKRCSVSIVCALIFGVFVSVFFIYIEYYRILIFTIRIPIYFLGFYVGYLIKDKNVVLTKKQECLAFFVMLFGIGLIYITIESFSWDTLRETGLRWSPFFLVIPSFCFFLAKIMDQFKGYSFPVLSFVGKYSLGIYILHESVLGMLTWSLPAARPVKNILAIFLVFILAYLWENLVSRIIVKCVRNKSSLPTSYLSNK